MKHFDSKDELTKYPQIYKYSTKKYHIKYQCQFTTTKITWSKKFNFHQKLNKFYRAVQIDEFAS